MTYLCCVKLNQWKVTNFFEVTNFFPIYNFTRLKLTPVFFTDKTVWIIGTKSQISWILLKMVSFLFCTNFRRNAQTGVVINNLFLKAEGTEVYSEPNWTSKMGLFAKIVNGERSLTFFTKCFILDVWLGSEYSSELHCVKYFRIWSYSSPCFPAFGLNAGNTEYLSICCLNAGECGPE